MAAFLRSPTSTQSPRRVLGDKSTNLTPRRLHKTFVNLDDVADVKTNLTDEMSRTKTPSRSVVGKVAGQKRSINMVEGAERVEEEQAPGKKVDEKVHGGKALEERQTIEGDSTRPTRQLTAMSSFHGSQEGPLPLEEQFSIQEEMSQTAVETLNATPLPVNQSQLAYHSFHAEQSQDSQGLSSLIDFDPEEEERAGQQTSPCSDKTVSMARTPEMPLSPEARRVMVGEKASLLKERLRLAMYKIQTDQINKSLSELEENSRRETRSPSLPSNLGNSPESRIAAARNTATAQDKPRVGNLNAITAPALLPTAFSARYMSTEEDGEDNMEIPSSPPVPRSQKGDDQDEEENAETPRAMPSLSNSLSFKDPNTPKTPGLPRVDNMERPIEMPRGLEKTPFGLKTLTSSVVKGEAANSLLELMRKGR